MMDITGEMNIVTQHAPGVDNLGQHNHSVTRVNDEAHNEPLECCEPNEQDPEAAGDRLSALSVDDGF